MKPSATGSTRARPPAHASAAEPRYRSGAVARMLQMPVATLRVWERRYRLTVAPAGGQRQYSAADVQRLALLKQLTELGHAIGRLAGLDMAGLQAVARTHAGVLARRAPVQPVAPAAPAAPLRVAVIGAGLGRRLQRAARRCRSGPPPALAGDFADPAQAVEALRRAPVDLLLVHAPSVNDELVATLEAVRGAPHATRVRLAVLFSYASAPACERLAELQVTMLREPQSDALLARWLEGQGASAAAPAPAWPAISAAGAIGIDATTAADAVDATVAAGPTPPRRWDDATLADFAGLSSTVACECPRHVAELLMQLSHFEAYSAECAHRSLADAALHAYLGQVAAACRSQFETALEAVARHEGLLLPPP
jgi:hypothetical protein